MTKNRLKHSGPDFIFTVILKPKNWRPRNYYDEPAQGKVVSKSLVASYEEAHDDLVRFNRASLTDSLETWAVIVSANTKSKS